MVDTLSAVLRALGFIALFQAVGTAVFLALFGSMLHATGPAAERVGFRSALIALVLLLAHYLLEAARMGGELLGVLDTSLQELALRSPVASVLAWRLLGLALVASSFRVSVRSTAQVLGTAGALLIVSSFALVGHTVDHPQRWLLSTALILHVLVITFWFGALVPLYEAAGRETATVAAAVTEAFSKLAVWVVPIIFAAGATLAIYILKSAAALTTTYGRMVLVKLALFAILLLLGALNRWRLGPALASGGPRAARAFRRSLAVEYVLMGGALAVTAVLTSFYSPD